MSDDLKSFKISGKVAQRIDRPAPKKGGKAEPQSVGFPRIEALVEAESPDLSGLSERHRALSEKAKTGGVKEKGLAKKAAIAYERTLDLLEHLLETKAALTGKKGE